VKSSTIAVAVALAACLGSGVAGAQTPPPGAAAPSGAARELDSFLTLVEAQGLALGDAAAQLERFPADGLKPAAQTRRGDLVAKVADLRARLAAAASSAKTLRAAPGTTEADAKKFTSAQSKLLTDAIGAVDAVRVLVHDPNVFDHSAEERARRDAAAAEARSKKDAQDAEARSKKDAQDAEARAKKDAQDAEARAKKDAQDAEARSKKEAAEQAKAAEQQAREAKAAQAAAEASKAIEGELSQALQALESSAKMAGEARSGLSAFLARDDLSPKGKADGAALARKLDGAEARLARTLEGAKEMRTKGAPVAAAAATKRSALGLAQEIGRIYVASKSVTSSPASLRKAPAAPPPPTAAAPEPPPPPPQVNPGDLCEVAFDPANGETGIAVVFAGRTYALPAKIKLATGRYEFTATKRGAGAETHNELFVCGRVSRVEIAAPARR
jgi:hypothetical protein